MILPAAAAPVAVLVLAWDEATPAVRALVEATEIISPLFDSVVVVVPAGPAEAAPLSQEEILPIAALPELPAPDSLPHPAAPADPLTEAATLTAPIIAPLAAILAPAPSSALVRASAPAAAPLPAATEAPAETPPSQTGTEASAVPALSWSVVRVLRLSSFSLPELAGLASQVLPPPIWQGILASPAAPYRGQSEAAAAAIDVELKQDAFNQLSDYKELTSVSALPAPSPGVAAARPLVAAAPPDYFAVELPAPAIEAESDLAPVQLASDDDSSAAAVVEAPPATEFAAARADWPEALAALREPALVEALAQPASLPAEDHSYPDATAAPANPELPAPTGPPALRPAHGRFDAPNLNFQVIQYARFAVPVALAEAPFEAIYAPAWPTWLAAQELRQRTGRPLVLHVSTLAATDDESVETATSWQAELQRQALHRADLILTETPALAYRLRHELSLPAHLVRPVPAADAAAIAQALHTAQPRPVISMS